MTTPAKDVLVWDWTIRLFHWVTVGLIPALWWTAEEGHMAWHARLGLTLLGLLVFRLYWGVFGSPTARFSSFVKGPSAILAYARSSLRRPYVPSTGHNPLGALSVVALLGLLVAQVSFGLFAVDVDGLESGPLSSLVDFKTGRQFAEWHEFTFELLLWMIGLHVLAVLGYWLVLKTNLVRPMVTGRRPAETATPETATRNGVSLPRLVIGVALAGLPVFAVQL
ncbi:cytochrome b/b6 domain-containing protein [Henriciella aquimarina]|uniref:cytochrome b/b6 domain-containing protein n=1 Tax=Henriciella aquimarina TaxID=545261 RepID=UPI0009FD9CC6|nr:cytochrome b/b6 domain-containing protein [Henriciella aquimarina]